MLEENTERMKLSYYSMVMFLLAMILGACTAGRNDPPTLSQEYQSNGVARDLIAYHANRENGRGIYIWDSETRAETKLTGHLEEIHVQFSWSPDGTRLVFQNGWRYEESELYVVNIQSGELEQLTDNNTMDENPDWSPDGDWIAFNSGVEASGGSRIWLINPDSRERKTVINDPRLLSDRSSSWPLWSPQATKIAVISPEGPDTITWGIFDVDTGRMIQLIKHDGAEVSMGPKMAAWRPDGKEFAYSSNQGGTFNIYTQAVGDGIASAPRRLTNLACDARMPVWHPDGETIMFTCLDLNESEQVESQLYVVDVETLEIQQLTIEGINFWGDWSPDGAQIVFGTKRDGAHYVAIMDSDGSNRTILEETKSAEIWMPRWAPVSAP